MSGTVELLDARIRRGTYLITTASGTQYFLEVCKSVAGGMRAISDGLTLKALREGTVGGCDCQGEDEPIIRVGSSMHLAERGAHIVITSPVASIEKIDDGTIDTVVCSRCKHGYRGNGQSCSLCRH